MGRPLRLKRLTSPIPGIEIIPYELNLAIQPDGALPAIFSGSTWTVASGGAKNTPRTLPWFVNGDFENSFTGWDQALGDGAIAIEASLVHGGTKAAKITSGVGLNTYIHQSIPGFGAGKKATISFWQRGDGINVSSYQIIDITNWTWWKTFNGPNTASYVQQSFLVNTPFNCNALRLDLQGPGANGGITYFDDVACLIYYYSADWFALANFNLALVMVKARWSIATGDLGGVVCCADVANDPQNYVYAYHDGTMAYMAKVVGGALSADLIAITTTYVDQADLEIRHTAPTTFQLWYNNVQVGADQTIADAGIISNTIHGLYGIGITGSSHCHVFACSTIATREVVFLGGSITAGANASDVAHRYVSLAANFMQSYYPKYAYASFRNAGVGATGSWWALFRLQADVIANAPDVITLDWSVNDLDRGSSKGAAEACIRRLIGALPNSRLVAIHFLCVAGAPGTDPTNTLEAVKQNCITLFGHYGIPHVDFAGGVQALVAGGASLATYLSDQVHPTDAGHAYAATMLETILPAALAGGRLTLPARLYDNGDYENTPILRNGTDNDGETGTGWATVDTTARQSSTAGDTIQWTATCQSFGLDGSYGVGAGTITYKVDANPEVAVDLATSGLAYLQAMWDGSGYRGLHTIIIKVVSGTVKISRFLAV